MLEMVLAEAHEINSLVDFIPGIHDWWQQFGYLGTTWLNHTHIEFTHVMMTCISMLVVTALIIGSWNKFKPAPDAKLTPRTLFEMAIELVHGLLKGQLHDEEKARKYLPLVFALAVFIFFNNVLALVPGLAPGTDNLNTNIGMALIVFFVSNIAAIQAKGLKGYLKEMCGPLPALAPLMFPIELIGQLVRPVTLTIRLMGNMFGDHAVVAVLATLVAACVPAVMMCLGALVVVIQTAVFCILTVVYISMAVSEH
ncbi:MAG: F0F1 ATP synthase subunit A [Proteobacteria bacterium]|nr:F0F1 ATP synthase subunit A [Pseudomonadota bacterium]MBQ4359930.1 F0F1 ATP synthase subunit A [Pseudomonadota bacterium]